MACIKYAEYFLSLFRCLVLSLLVSNCIQLSGVFAVIFMKMINTVLSGIKLPKFGGKGKVKTPKADVDIGGGIDADIKGPSVDIDTPKVDIDAPDVDVKAPSGGIDIGGGIGGVFGGGIGG